ncbi:MAG: zinc-ribbon domain-containing protein [Geobacter sp.]|nr:zinc-ribbon domain-containing protein [Geobacter sp.]
MMIVQCEQCATRFRLDDAKVGEQGVKVRCSKCRFVFVVKKERQEQVTEEPDFDALLSGLGGAPSISGNQESAAPTSGADSPEQEAVPDFSPEQKQEDVPETPVTSEVPTVSRQDDWLSDFDPASLENDDAPHVGAIDSSAMHMEPAEAGTVASELPDWLDNDATVDEESSSDAHLPGSTQDTVAESQPEAVGEEVSFASEPWPETSPAFDDNADDLTSQVQFNSWESDVEPSVAMTDQAEPDVTPPEESAGEFSFESEDEQRGEEPSFAEETAEPVETGVGEMEMPPPAAGITWDMGKAEEEKDFVSAAVQRFQSQPPIATVSKDEDHTTQSEVGPPPVADMPAAQPDEELPPLSIASRRKGSSLFPAAITVVSVLFIVVLAGVGFYMLNEGPAAFNKLGIATFAKWAGLNSGEEGSITLRNTTGEFLSNKVIGDIFVVRGEAVNAYAKPRASIQVKASLYAAQKGQPIMTKTAYCGNLLTREQLTTLPFAKLETVMNNQFGDSLANLGVQPGKAIPFVIVFANVPKDAGEFGLEVVGSTVAGP